MAVLDLVCVVRDFCGGFWGFLIGDDLVMKDVDPERVDVERF